MNTKARMHVLTLNHNVDNNRTALEHFLCPDQKSRFLKMRCGNVIMHEELERIRGKITEFWNVHNHNNKFI